MYCNNNSSRFKKKVIYKLLQFFLLSIHYWLNLVLKERSISLYGTLGRKGKKTKQKFGNEIWNNKLSILLKRQTGKRSHKKGN